MNRRVYLHLASTAVLTATAGCLDDFPPTSKQTTPQSNPRTSHQIEHRTCKDTENTGTLTTSSENTVIATGTVVGDSTCDDLKLTTFSNEDSSEAIIELTVMSGEGADCQDCMTAIDYRATISYPDTMPETFNLVYDTRHGTEPVDVLKTD